MTDIASKQAISKPSWAKTFPRLYELYSASAQGGPYNYFEHPNMKKVLLDDPPDSQLLEVEKDLEQMNQVAWKEFKSKTVGYVVVQDKWGWPRQLFDLLNEAKGYCYLSEQGCTDIYFLQEKDKKGEVTPDLCGKREPGLVLLEVKTVHESEDNDNYLTRRGKYQVERVARSAQYSINEAMKKKLQGTIDKATKQLFSENLNLQRPIIQRVIFLVVWLDTDCATRQTEEELAQFLNQIYPQGCKLVHRVANRMFVD